MLSPFLAFTQQTPDSLINDNLLLPEDPHAINYNDDVEEEFEDRIFDFIELDEPASYPGGEVALLNFITENYVLDPFDIKNNTTGVIQVVFIIEKNGKVSNVKVIRGLTDTANREAIRVLKLMPRWKPAYLAKKPVLMRFMVPIYLTGKN